MSKIEITDEMVERAWATMPDAPQGFLKADLERALNAALNPPPEPEIVVTEEMQEAGAAWLASYRGNLAWAASFAGIYRAMYAARPKDDPVPGKHNHYHYRANDNACRPIFHRRQDDPK